TARGLKAVFSGDTGLKLAEGERAEKLLNEIEPGKETSITWMLNPQRQAKNGKFKLSVTGSNILALDIPGEVTIPALSAGISFSNPGTLRLGQVFSLNLEAANLYEVQDFVTNIKYDPKQLRLVYISRGTFLVEDEQLSFWSNGVHKYQEGRVEAITGKRSQPFNGVTTTLVRLNFMAVGSGEGAVQVENLALHDKQGNKLPYQITPIKYQIVEEKK
ncbi:MAG TPA: cohesin domain-containing protein, partial [Bacillota bacterium]|nr:cohesin domain-containing protein [Bacillota bacterium]